MGDDSDDYDLSESFRRFRGAGTDISVGFTHLYYGTKRRVTNQHPVVQLGITAILWFGGNWIYNRIKTPVFDTATAIVDAVPAEFLVSSPFGIVDSMSFPLWAQALGILSGIIVAQNRTHTRKLKRMERKLASMSQEPATATDGGVQKAKEGGGGGVGGAIAGGFAGAPFGPGGALAGAFLGYIIGENITEDEAESLTDDEIDPFAGEDDS